MTSDGDALFRAICEEPWEDTPCLMYADWLQENGDAGRAEFIRLQVELAKPGANFDAPELAVRARQLHTESHGRWTRGSPTGNGVRIHRDLRRGFYSGADFRGEDTFTRRAAEAFGWTPIDTVMIRSVSRDRLGDVLAVPYLVRVASLTLWQEYDDRGLQDIARCLKLLHLTRLDTLGTRITDEGALALARSPYLRWLKNVRLAGAVHLTPATVRILSERFEQFSVR
jgi:uncharacterized protein (TIGR02996 family)